MRKLSIPDKYYEKRFRHLIKSSFCQTEPEEKVLEVLRKLPTGKMCDIGCGNGRDGIAAARHGLSVVCLDRMPLPVDYIKTVSKAEHLPMTALHCNILGTKLKREFNFVNASYVLDEFSKADGESLIRIMQNATMLSGYNTIAARTVGTVCKDPFRSSVYYFSKEELVALYEQMGWTVLSVRVATEKKVHNSPVIRFLAQRHP